MFYLLASLWQKRGIIGGRLRCGPCGAAWWLLNYWAVRSDCYTPASALAGVGLMVVYRLSLLENHRQSTRQRQRFAVPMCSNLWCRWGGPGHKPAADEQVRGLVPGGPLCTAMALATLGTVWLVPHAA